jgi:hypothetical protein
MLVAIMFDVRRLFGPPLTSIELRNSETNDNIYVYTGVSHK